MTTHTFGGGIDQTAVIGHAPEGREWRPWDPAHAPSIHHTARIEAYATVDAGIEVNTYVGPGAWLMKHSHVGHDAVIGADCEVSPGAVICGYARLGEGVKVGVNASVLPRIVIGPGARIGAGSVVTKNVPAGETWAGNPARRLYATSLPDCRVNGQMPDYDA